MLSTSPLDMESFDCVTAATDISPPVPIRKYLPRDSPKVCTVCNATTSSVWRTNGKRERICNKCAMKAKYNKIKTSQTYHEADLVRQEISKLLIKYGTAMRLKQIVKLLEGEGGLEGVSKLDQKISYNIRKSSKFARVSPGVYRINT